MSEPIPLNPKRIKTRGKFPKHSDTPQPQRTAAEARAYARQRYEEWKATHG